MRKRWTDTLTERMEYALIHAFRNERGFFGGGGSPPSPPPPPPPPPTLEDPAAQKARQDAAMRARMRMGRAATFLTQGGGSGLTGPAGGAQNPGLGGGGGTQNLGG